TPVSNRRLYSESPLAERYKRRIPLWKRYVCRHSAGGCRGCPLARKSPAGVRSREWNSWRKAEAVYDALLISAKRDNDKNRPDLYLGAGMLKAGDALRQEYANIRKFQSKALRFRPMALDEFSGSESFWRLLFEFPPTSQP